jgi:hypothetical protein
MVVAVATRREAPEQVVLDLGSAELQSPLYLAIPVEKVNEILGLIRGFVEKVVENPRGNHELELPMSLIEGACSEMEEYKKNAKKELESLREKLKSDLITKYGFGEVEVKSHVKEPESWVEKVVGRLLLREGDEKSPYLKDMFRFAVIVEDESKLDVVHDTVREFLDKWQNPAVQNNSSDEYFPPRCDNFLSEPKRKLGEPPKNSNSPWRGIKGYVVTVRGFVLEYQVTSRKIDEEQNKPTNPAHHTRYEERRTAEIEKRAAELGLPPDFVPFFQQLLRQILVAPETELIHPTGITIV